jgi:hypothetical protein
VVSTVTNFTAELSALAAVAICMLTALSL